MKNNFFTDVQTFPYGTKALSSKEICALMAVVQEILDCFDEVPNKGTIILDGQEKGEEARCIMRMNLEKGVYLKNFHLVYQRTSATLAEESIDAALGWPENGAYDCTPMAKNFGEMPTGMYLCGSHKVMVLNTTFGRFVASFQLAVEKADTSNDEGQVELSEYCDENVAAMKGWAVALAKMRPKDLVLGRSVKRLTENATPMERRIKEEVENLFYFCTLPELAVWKEWHDAEVKGKKKIGLFFE